MDNFTKKSALILSTYLKEYKSLRSQIALNENALGNKLDEELSDLFDKFVAAKKALGLVDKLKPGKTKAKHASRVMTNLNKIRAGLLNLEKEIKKMVQK